MNRRIAFAAALATSCLVGPHGAAALAAGQPSKERSAPVVVHASDGFDWGDAAIGAAAGIGAALATAGALTLARNK